MRVMKIKEKTWYFWWSFKDFFSWGRIIRCCRGEKCIHRHYPLSASEKIMAFVFGILPKK